MQSQAVLLAESKMAEVVSGATAATSTGDSSFGDSDLEGWTYNINVSAGGHTGINQVTVTVQCHQAENVDATFSMTRLLRDQQAFVTSAIQAAKQKALQAGITQQQSQASQ
jgi:hypothetical protein